MKRILFLFVIISILKVNAQTVFLPNVGTTWHYLFGKYGPSSDKFNAKIEYTKDSIYSGDSAKVLVVDRIYTSCNVLPKYNVFVKQKNDSVWFSHTKTNNTWQLLIDFNASVGQSWKFDIHGSSNALVTYTVKVNSVSTNTVNNFSLKTLNVTYIPSNSALPTHTSIISERFGDMSYLFDMPNYIPSSSCDFDYIESFLCYQDSTFGQMQFTSNSCDYQYILGIEENTLYNKNIKIFPNPVSNILNIDIENSSLQNATIQIITLLGQKIIEGKLEKTIEISALQNGIYFLQVFDEGKLISTQKIIKE